MIPEHAKKVFEGVIFDVYQWEQGLFNGKTTMFEMLDRADTGEVIVTKGDKILLQHQEQPAKDPFLCLPGGRIEKGEDPLDGTKRELLEETGYVSDDWELLHEVVPHSKLHWSIYVYIARNAEWKQEQELDGGEKIELKWVGFEELLELVNDNKLSNLEQDLRMMLVRAYYDEASRETLRTQIFGG